MGILSKDINPYLDGPQGQGGVSEKGAQQMEISSWITCMLSSFIIRIKAEFKHYCVEVWCGQQHKIWDVALCDAA